MQIRAVARDNTFVPTRFQPLREWCFVGTTVLRFVTELMEIIERG